MRKQENQSNGNVLQIGNERIFGKKQIGKGKVLAEVFDMQIFDKDYHDMIMIDEFSDDMINLAMKYLENEGNKQSRCLYFQVQFKQFLYLENSNIEPDILNLKKMIPRFIDNIFDNLDYLGFPFQQTNKMITHFTLVDFRKKSCVTYQLIDNSQKNNYYQSQGKKFGDKVYTFLQQFHRNKLLRELDFRNWSNEQSQQCFQSASERQGSNIMLSMMNLITQKNTNFKVITDSYVVATKQKISNFISQNKKK
ncbi:hypothetical protein PPERSA_09965 [Pseudocohnilembus persalinus]|uniref:Uncharacterized protein n=1 Tax=Pseudocohnilembus persalinus TaxID=266149 RepID=A0A0V0QJU2_PSEPJ|nr:hypothetical protein PPERSA_09965 [Pseudocohnilembus persalinus]|eukprot:KRX02348.1 hypothetical protein PPERSA_09965 [Pseudocohnilembus persalinus]